ncbi:MAG: cisplatin damage response ATP-dependent DNA ligase, partial [Hyphomicrobiales bacterium]
MLAFANLLDRLILTPSRNAKLQLLVDYFAETPDPDRGLAVAAITGDLKIANVKPALLRSLIEERMDPVLFELSYDYVGDMAETISLVWPDTASDAPTNPTLSDVINTLQTTSRQSASSVVVDLLGNLETTPRWALLKLITGGLRIGVSSRLLKQALANFGHVDVSEIEELWHGLDVPYTDLFQWLEGKADKPVSTAVALFRPVMLAHALEDGDHSKITPQDFAVEWKWDGIRIQAVGEAGTARLYSRTGDDISPAFPDIVDAMNFDAALDGELLVQAKGEEQDGLKPVASFGDLQQRLNRKKVSKKQLETHPAFIRIYDILQEGDENLR